MPSASPRVLVLGAGPAAVATALLLRRQGHDVRVIGRLRAAEAIEGVSDRAIEGLRRLECARALAVLDTVHERVAAWNGQVARVNREHVAERRRLDAALLEDLAAAGVPWRSAGVVSASREGRGGWRVGWSEGAQAGSERADFLVEARGAAATRRSADVAAGPRALAISRQLAGGSARRAITVAESFPDGWAWCAIDRDGAATVQVVVDASSPAATRSHLPGLHDAALARLAEVSAALGRAAAPPGPPRVRAIWPRLRGALVGPDWLRVGDAAATCDPLSGHGIFETLSSAFAAAPAIHTIVREPQRPALAIRFFEERTRERFDANLRRAEALCRAEERWTQRPFWRARRGEGAAAQVATGDAAAVVRMAVVEDGSVVEREVVRCADYPLGVRFLGSVELARLHALLAGLPGEPGVERLSAALDAPPVEVLGAWRWLQARGLAAGPDRMS